MSVDERTPARYSLQSLLDSGRQPLPDLESDQFEGLRKGLGKGPLADPLSVSSDGILLDGHQRARALLANGRKFIDASEVHVVAVANRDNAYEWAVQLNVSRRHLTVEQKAELARQLQRERRWSQAKIAKLFGVSRPAVSQWLAKHPDDDGSPIVVSGVDGKTYVSEPTPAREVQRNPWRPDGYAFKALHRAVGLVEREPVGGLGMLHASKLRALAEDMIAACETLVSKLTRGDDDEGEGDL